MAIEVRTRACARVRARAYVRACAIRCSYSQVLHTIKSTNDQMNLCDSFVGFDGPVTTARQIGA